MDILSCDPPRPWQRVADENANDRCREYLPWGIDVSQASGRRTPCLGDPGGKVDALCPIQAG
jgi:IS30 family transposase